MSANPAPKDAHSLLQFNVAAIVATVAETANNEVSLAALDDFGARLLAHITAAKQDPPTIENPADLTAMLAYDVEAVVMGQVGNTDCLDRLESFGKDLKYFVDFLKEKYAEDDANMLADPVPSHAMESEEDESNIDEHAAEGEGDEAEIRPDGVASSPSVGNEGRQGTADSAEDEPNIDDHVPEGEEDEIRPDDVASSPSAGNEGRQRTVVSPSASDNSEGKFCVLKPCEYPSNAHGLIIKGLQGKMPVEDLQLAMELLPDPPPLLARKGDVRRKKQRKKRSNQITLNPHSLHASAARQRK